MTIKQCPYCSGGKIPLPRHISFKKCLDSELSNITFLRCEKCGAVYWRTRWHYVALFIASAVYFLCFFAIVSIVEPIFGSSVLYVGAVILGISGYHYMSTVCTFRLPWRHVIIKAGSPPMQSRFYLVVANVAGILVALCILLCLAA